MTVSVGVPRETKDLERRVVLTPSAVALVVAAGHRVVVESGAGRGAGFDDDAYRVAGAELGRGPADAWACDLVAKVKEPQPHEFAFLRPGLTLFGYLHLAAERALTEHLVAERTDAYAFETLVDAGLPLLAPMSEVAGRAAAIIAANLLSTAAGGSGTLVGGAAGVPPARAVVLGLGVSGRLAARGLRGLDAHVTGVDVDLDRLREVRLDGTVDATSVSEPKALDSLVAEADVLIGAALVAGRRAPMLVTAAQVARMRPGSVIIDLAIDQGGCIATSRPTSLSAPTYVAEGVLHYCVTNIPGQFPRTASAALSAAVAPRLLALAGALAPRTSSDPARAPLLQGLVGAANVIGGQLVHPGVAAAFPDLPAAVLPATG